MASETVKRILDAEAEAERLTSEARKRAEDIVAKAQQDSAIGIQKKISEAKSEADTIKKKNAEKLKEYTLEAEKNLSKDLENLKKRADENSDKAVSAIISAFFS